MKKTLLSATVLTLALTAGSVALADHHKGMHGPKAPIADANQDGQVSKAEFDSARANQFAKMDADKNGQVSAAEMQAHHEAMKAERMARRAERQKARMDKHLAILDTNKDGQISQAEFAAKGAEHFAKMDANKDGQISADERRKGRDGMMGGKGKGDKAMGGHHGH